MARPRRSQQDEPPITPDLLAAVQHRSRHLYGFEDLDPLLERIGDARYVLLGEATHGTAEFYAWRMQITLRLLQEKGFSFIAVEGDWPDCYRLNHYVKGHAGAAPHAHDGLIHFARWPTWMWANYEIEYLLERLRRFNDARPAERRVGFYGLDVYSLWESMHAVMEYLEKTDGAAAAAAQRAFECFEPYAEDVYDYARAAAWSPDYCRDEVVQLLRELRHVPLIYDPADREARFNAEQNALTARNAEHYYRTLTGGDAASWNVRDRHMTETLERLMQHHGPHAKCIVWGHNTHIGDARHTDMAEAGMVNVGQLLRETHSSDGVVLVGFSSHRGSVVAGEEWGAPMHVMPVSPARPGSWEDVLHQAEAGDKLLIFDGAEPDELRAERGHRAIGVVYHPHREQYGNYVPTSLPQRYDALLHIDRSHALRPLHVPGGYEYEVPETYPTGL